jgi:hypothetical protein
MIVARDRGRTSEGNSMRAALVAVAMGTALIVSGCGGDDADATASPSPTSTPVATPTESPTEPSPAPTEELTDDEKVLADYQAAWVAAVAAYDPPNSQDSELLARFDGNALEGTQQELDELAGKGHSEIVEFDSDPELIVREPDGAAILRDCFTAHVRTVDTESRDEVEPPQSQTWNIEVNLVLRDDTWIIVRQVALEEQC